MIITNVSHDYCMDVIRVSHDITNVSHDYCMDVI